MSTIAEPVNVNRHEIAAILRVCLQTVDRLVKANAFPSFKIGGARLAWKTDVLAFNQRLRDAAAEQGREVQAFELLAEAEAGHAQAAETLSAQTKPEATGSAASSP